MWKNINLDKCLSYIKSRREAGDQRSSKGRPAITISRMCGSGGRTVASKLAEDLQPYTPYGWQWTIFDKNLIEKVLEDHHLSRRLSEFLPESGKSPLAATIRELRGLHLSASSIVKQTVETVWNLAEGGYVILIGRAANVITASMENVFHVRLVGSMEKRVARLETVHDIDRTAAREYLKTQDAGKQLYLKEYFGCDVEDPLLYHLIINTDEISYEHAARLIADTMVNRFKLEPASKMKMI